MNTTESKEHSLPAVQPQASDPQPTAEDYHRKEFEAWCCEHPEKDFAPSRINWPGGPTHGEYIDWPTECAWQAWLKVASRLDSYRTTVEWLRELLAGGAVIHATDPSAPLLQIKERRPNGTFVIHGGLTLHSSITTVAEQFVSTLP